MAVFCRPVTLIIVGLFTAQLYAQSFREVLPPVFVASHPEKPCDRNRKEAHQLYARGLFLARANRVAEAIESFEKAARLDPKATAPGRALAPLYVASGRIADAVKMCHDILEIAPHDYETWYFLARQIKAQGNLPAAEQALRHALSCPLLRNSPELFVLVSFDLASMYEDGHHYKKAIKVYEQTIELLNGDNGNPQTAEVYERLGKVALKSKNYALGVRAFKNAQQILLPADGPRALRLSYPLALAYDDQGKSDQAIRELDRYLQTEPTNVEPYKFKISLLKKLGRTADVIPSLKAAVERDNHNISLRLLLARQYAEVHDSANAERIYLALASEQPGPDIYRGLFKLFESEKCMGDALQLLDVSVAAAAGKGDAQNRPGAVLRARAMMIVLQTDSGLARNLITATQNRLGGKQALQPETRRLLGPLAVQSGQLEMAEKLFESCLTSETDPRIRAQIYDGLLQVLRSLQKYQVIVELSQKELKDASPAGRLLWHANAAQALVLMHKIDRALEEIGKAIQISTKENRLHFQLLEVDILRIGERFDKAEAACHALLEKTTLPGEVRDIRYALSNVYAAAHNIDKSEQVLHSILEADPDDPTANNDLGYLLADRGKQLPEAEKMIRRAIQVDRQRSKSGRSAELAEEPEKAAFVDSLGWVLFRSGKIEDARVELEKAASLPSGASDPVVWGHLADVYQYLDEWGQARHCWVKAIGLYEGEKRRKLDEHYQEIKTKLKLLDLEVHP